MDGLVSYRLNDGVAEITMDDGRLNVMSPALLAALRNAFDRAAEAGAIVVFRSGRPGIFSAGFDLKVFAANDPEASSAMVTAGAELAIAVMTHPAPVITVCEGHAYPMGAFLILASDLRIAVRGEHRIGLNEVAIGIAVPSFALELARHRLTPAGLQRTTLTGLMLDIDEARLAGFFDVAVEAEALPGALADALEAARRAHLPSHVTVKSRLRGATVEAMKAAIDAELGVEAYRRRAEAGSTVRLPARASA